MAIDTGSAGFGGALFAIIGIWSVVGLGAYVWYLWSLARLFPYLGLPAAHGWIPVWNQWRLIERGGLPGWTAVLGVIPGLNLVTIVVSIIAIHRINHEHGEGGGMTVLGALVPPLWATLLGSRFQDRSYATGGQPGAHGRGQATLGLVEYGPDGQVYPLLPGAQEAQPTPQFSMPPVQLPHVAPAAQTSQAAPSARGSEASQRPPAAAPPQVLSQRPDAGEQPLTFQPPVTPRIPAPASPAPPIVPTANPAANATEAENAAEQVAPNTGQLENPWGFGKTTEGNFQRLASESLPSREPSFGGGPDARPFSWPQPAASPTSGPASPMPPAAQGDAQAPGQAAGSALARSGDPEQPAQLRPEPAAVAPAPVAPSPVAPVAPVSVAQTSDAEAAAVSAADQSHGAEPGVAERTPSVSGPIEPAPMQPAPTEPAPTGPEAEPVDPVELMFFPEPGATPEQHPEPASSSEQTEQPSADALPEHVAASPAQVLTPTPLASRVGPTASETGESGADAPESADHGFEEDDLDRTVVVSRRARWVLELPDGEQYPLDGTDIVIGRKPSAVEGSAVLTVPDATRTLSKSHARLRLGEAGWTIEDLHSTNGVFVIDQAGGQTELAAGVPVEATEELVIGTLEVRLRLIE